MRKLGICLLFSLFVSMSLHAQPETTPYIRVDQFGYRPQDAKVAVLADPQEGFNAEDEYVPGATIEVRRAGSGEVVFSGAPEAWKGGATHAQSGDRGWWFDFTPVTSEGTYYLFDTENDVRSHPFLIHENVYADVLEAALRMFYYNRSGIAKPASYAGECWADDASFVGPHQDTEARLVSAPPRSRTEKDMSGGWFDAGDYNKYVTFVEPVIHQLLDAYTQNPDAWTDNVNIPESGNGIPDLVDEVVWELDWLKKMQDTTDGGVHIKMGSTTFDLGSPPSSDTAPRYYGPKCSSSSIAAAGMFAHAAIVLDEFDAFADYAEDLEQRAVEAWDWYHANPKEENCDTQKIKAGDADRSVDEQKEMAVSAAVYLYALTGESDYGAYVVDHHEEVDNLGWWGPYRVDRGDALLYYTTLDGADVSVADHILSRLRNAGRSLGEFYGMNEGDLYRAHMPDAQYHWGSNNVKANTGNLNMNLLTYEQDTGRHETYRNKALSSLHYMHGVNPLGKVYLSNMSGYGAENSADAIYHGWFKGPKWGDAETSTCGPAPGYVPGGPNKNYSGTQPGIAGQPPQKAYQDGGSYSNAWEITEPAVYYQSAYLKLLSKFVPDHSLYVGVDETPAPLQKLDLHSYPNPFTRSTRVEYRLADEATVQAVVYDLLGRRVRTLAAGRQSGGKHVLIWDGTGDDGSNLPSGSYLVRLTTDEGNGRGAAYALITLVR